MILGLALLTNHHLHPHFQSHLRSIIALIVVVGACFIAYKVLSEVMWRKHSTIKATAYTYFQAQPLPSFVINNWEQAESFLIQLAGLTKGMGGASTPHYRFLVIKWPPDGQIEFVFGVDPEHQDGFQNAIRAAYPDLEMVALGENPTDHLRDLAPGVAIAQFTLAQKADKAMWPLKMMESWSVADPLNATVSGMNAGRPGAEVVVLEILFSPLAETTYLYQPINKALKGIQQQQIKNDNLSLQAFFHDMNKEGWGTSSAKPKSGGGGGGALALEDQQAIAALRKKGQPPNKAYRVAIRMGVWAPVQGQAVALLRSARSGLEQWTAMNALTEQYTYASSRLTDDMEHGIMPSRGQTMVLSSAELVSMIRVLDSTHSPLFPHVIGAPVKPIRAASTVISHDFSASDAHPMDGPPQSDVSGVEWVDPSQSE